MVTVLGKGQAPVVIRKRRRALAPNPMLFSVVCFLALRVLPARALVSIPEFHEEYISLPARFGGKLSDVVDENNPPIRAYLTLVKDQPYMCSDELKNIQPRPPFMNNMGANSPNENANNNTVIETKAPNNNTVDASMTIDKHDTSFVIDIANQDILPLPPPPTKNNLPVALLVERGMCTFYEKAIMASQYGDFVKYVIIYDDQVAPDLVPMSSEFETDMTLLFVSATTGRALRNHIVMASQMSFKHDSNLHMNMGMNMSANLISTNETNTGGDEVVSEDERFFGYNLVVELDGTSPYFQSDYRGLNMAAYFLAAMSGFLAFLIFFGCLLICAQCGCITAAPDEHGRIVLFAGGPGIRPPDTLARIIRVDKLTVDQVMLLDEEEFDAPEGEETEEGDSSACCAICLEEFEHREKVRVLPCGHKFHEDCLIPWLTERHASCPLCKMDVLEHVKKLEAKENGGTEKDMEEGRNHDNDSASQATASSNTPRSFWYRLRGWSLVDGTPAPASTEASPSTVTSSTNGSNNSLSLGVSEIEMETMSASAAGSETVATGH